MYFFRISAYSFIFITVYFQDNESGLRSIGETPDLHGVPEAFSQYDNFIIGSTDPSRYFAQLSCCNSSIAIRIQDVNKNEKICELGNPLGISKNNQIQLSSTTGIIVAIVAVIVCISVIIVAIGIFIRIRRKRSAELAEMRASPQAR